MFMVTLGNFRFGYEYEIRYQYDFPIPVCRLYIITSTPTSFLELPSLLVNYKKECGLWKCHWFEIQKLYS